MLSPIWNISYEVQGYVIWKWFPEISMILPILLSFISFRKYAPSLMFLLPVYDKVQRFVQNARP